MPTLPTPVLPKRLPHGPHPSATADHVSPLLVEASAADSDAALQRFGTSAAGLSDVEAGRRLRETGPNVVARDERHPRLRLLRKALVNPLVILLVVLAAFSIATGDVPAASVMLVMVVLGVVVRFAQEARADSAAAKLRAMISVHATVLREGQPREVPIADLVPGDVVELTAGDMIPADVRLLACKDLFVIQGSLTGESFPVEKFAAREDGADRSPLERNNVCYLGTSVEGRKVFANILKYVRMGASSNFGNMFSVLGASAFLPFVPILPIQILANNLLYDFSQVAIPTDDVDSEQVAQPRPWSIGQITRYILFIGPCSSVFDYVLFFTMLYGFGCWDPANASLFQTAWFVESLLTQTLIIHVIRTNRIPFVQSRASGPLLATTAAVMLVGASLPFSPLGPSLGFTPLPLLYWPVLTLILLGYVILTQAVKTWLLRKSWVTG